MGYIKFFFLCYYYVLVYLNDLKYYIINDIVLVGEVKKLEVIVIVVKIILV